MSECGMEPGAPCSAPISLRAGEEYHRDPVGGAWMTANILPLSGEAELGLEEQWGRAAAVCLSPAPIQKGLERVKGEGASTGMP